MQSLLFVIAGSRGKMIAKKPPGFSKNLDTPLSKIIKIMRNFLKICFISDGSFIKSYVCKVYKLHMIC